MSPYLPPVGERSDLEVFAAAFGGGLAAGLIGVLLSFLQEWFRMRPRIQIFVAQTYPGFGLEGPRTIAVSPSNTGYRQVHLTGSGFILSGNSKIQLGQNLFGNERECKLLPGENYDFYFALGPLKERYAMFGRRQFRKAFVNDSVGRTWTTTVSHSWIASLLLEVNDGTTEQELI